MRICFFPMNMDAAGCYRCIFPMVYLSSQGWKCGMPDFEIHQDGKPVMPLNGPGLLGKIPPGVFDIMFLESSVPAGCDVYVFQHGSAQWQLDWAQKIRKHSPDAKIVVDLDDDFHRVPQYNPAKMDPGNSPLINRRNVVKMLELSDAASFATPALHRFYSRWQPNSSVIANYLHWPMWAQLPPVHERREWERPRVGYMGVSHYHSEDLKLIAKPLRKWLIAHPEVEFVAAGDPLVHDIIGTPEDQRVSTAQVFYRGLDLPYITSCFDVGLIPLVKNDFNQCKSWLKGLEYAACGIPSIATPTESYKSFIIDGHTGRLADYPRDFIAALDDALEHPDAWREMGRRAWHRARDCSLDARVGEWVDWFEAVCNGDHADSGRQGTLAGAVS